MTPVFIDQFYWARRVDALRVGVGFSAPLKSIRAAALGAAIRTCVSDVWISPEKFGSLPERCKLNLPAFNLPEQRLPETQIRVPRR